VLGVAIEPVQSPVPSGVRFTFTATEPDKATVSEANVSSPSISSAVKSMISPLQASVSLILKLDAGGHDPIGQYIGPIGGRVAEQKGSTASVTINS